MPEYYSDKSHSSGFSEINLNSYAERRTPKYRRAKDGKPEETEQQRHQKLLDEFGKRLAAQADKKANAQTLEDYEVEDKQSIREKETEYLTQTSHQVEDKQFREQTAKPELESRSQELELEQIISTLITQGEKVYKQHDYVRLVLA